MIWIGTSGFQYPEWKGSFYPEDLSKAKMLGYYSERFPTTEINYTFRHIPSAKTLQRWTDETAGSFIFSLKAPQRLTHFAKLRHCEETLNYFYQTVLGLKDKLGVILFQLPPSFAKDLAVLRAFLKIIPRPVRAAFEFRDASWFDEEVWAALRENNVALCVAETAEFSTPIVRTADFAYFRLRRETYDEADLTCWAAQVKQTGGEEAFVYFKHEAAGVGPKFARLFTELCAP